MKIILVNFHNHEIQHGMYGLVSLASYLEEYSNNIEVQVIDAIRQPFYDILTTWKPDIVAMSAYSYWYGDVLKHAFKVKQLMPNVKIVLGGHSVTSLPKSFWNPPFDYGIIGEGEEALLGICNGLIVKGVITEHFNGGIEHAEHTDPISVEKFPVVRLDKYTPITNYPNNTVGIVTSRGCSFNCKYCAIRTMSKDVRLYPVKRVADEIQLYYDKLGARFIKIWDDVFGLNIPWLNELINELSNRKLLGKIKYEIHVRASTVTEERCYLWKKLGVTSWNMGLDFGSDNILKMVKGQSSSVEKNKEALLLGGVHGFTTRCSFIFGAPEETIEDMAQTLNLMDWYATNKEKGLIKGDIWFFIATPFPGTEWWDIAKSKGKVSWDMDLTRLHLHNWKDHFMLEDSINDLQLNHIHEEAKKLMIRINGNFGEPF